MITRSYFYILYKSKTVNAGIWHVLKSKNGEPRISFALGESELRGDQVIFFVETLADYLFVDKEAFLKIRVS